MMNDKPQVWQELVNPFTTYERQALVEADLSLKPRRQQVTKSQMRELIKTITDAFCALDRQWRCVYINDQWEGYYGRCSEELLGNVLWDECPTLRGTSFETECRRAMSEQTPVHYHWRPNAGALFPCLKERRLSGFDCGATID
jgi:PAS domain-containing protein